MENSILQTQTGPVNLEGLKLIIQIEGAATIAAVLDSVLGEYIIYGNPDREITGDIRDAYRIVRSLRNSLLKGAGIIDLDDTSSK
jgi:hypothetical protein